MKKVLLGTLSVLGLVMVLGIVVFFVMASYGPETFVVSGKQLSGRYVNQLQRIGLLHGGEKIAFFYSDALMDIQDGLYFVSDKNVVAYSKDWHEPAITVPLESVIELSFQQDDSFWEDSVIWIRTNDEIEFSVPVSSEKGGDVRFYKYLARMCMNAQSVEQLDEAAMQRSAPNTPSEAPDA